MAYPVPEIWKVSGMLNKNGVPFSEGKVYADNFKNGVFYQIAETGISADGSFTLTYSRANFQDGDAELEYPTIRIRIEDYQGNLLWTSNVYSEPNVNLDVGFIDILKSPSQNGDCCVFGTVKNEQGNVLSGLKVKAYCLHFEETPTCRFRKIELGFTDLDDEGEFVIRYNSTILPQGFLLDSKEDYGKDKVSLYAEVFKEDNGSLKSLAVERLVFNGKRDQEINFILKAVQEYFTCEFQKLDSLLNIYFAAVFSEYGGDSWTKKISAITAFLNSNTTFPLVVGRERLTEAEIFAYFKAHSLYFQLLNRYNTTPPNEKYAHFLLDDTKRYWCEVFFALSMREGIASLYQMIQIKPTILQKALLGAVSDRLICVDTNDFLELWQQLLSEGISPESEENSETSLTINQMLLLYLSGNLPIVGSDSCRYESNISKENISQHLPVDKALLFAKLLDAYYNVGANTDALIRILQKFALRDGENETGSDLSGSQTKILEMESSGEIIGNLAINSRSILYPQLTDTQILRLKTIFDLNDFFEKFADGVVCAYHYAFVKSDFEFKRFADFVKFTESDWTSIVEAIATNYGRQFGTPITENVDNNSITTYPQSLPPEFPGANTELKKVIYTRKLVELIKTWFPQQSLFVDLEKKFEDAVLSTAERTEITDETTGETIPVEPDENLIKLLENWKDVCLTLQDFSWDEFSLSDSDLNEFLEQHSEILVSENNKKLIQQLQRLFHLTNSATAMAYLIEKGFDSAYKIASIEEDLFVASYGNGIGKTEDAKQIHRLAENYTVEAALNIQAYASDSSVESEGTLPSLPRTVSSRARLVALKSRNATNIANERYAIRDTVNWTKLFGKINYAKATEGQSILSASAYYIDLLKFLKKSSAYSIFAMRRPDYLDLKLTKANAEIPMPTIDLGIELLECLVAGPVEKNGFAWPVANNNLNDAEATVLRAEPSPFNETIDVEKNGEILQRKIADLALERLSKSKYPMQLPQDFNRERAKSILANMSLHFYDIATAADIAPRELRLNSIQKDLISSNSLTKTPIWELWGLEKTANKVLMPNKVDYATGGYLDVLRHLSFFCNVRV